MVDMLWQPYYARYIIADILQQISYGRCITANSFGQIYCVQQKRQHLSKCTAPGALDCCIGICLLQRIAPRTSQERFIHKKATKIKQCLQAPTMEENGSAKMPPWLAPTYISNMYNMFLQACPHLYIKYV